MGTQTSNSCANIGQRQKLNTKVNKVFTLCKSRTAAVILYEGSGAQETGGKRACILFHFFSIGDDVGRKEQKGHMWLGEQRQTIT